MKNGTPYMTLLISTAVITSLLAAEPQLTVADPQLSAAPEPLPTPEMPKPQEEKVRPMLVIKEVDKVAKCTESRNCRLLAELGYHEARSERDAGVYTVMWVAVNRLKERHRGARSLREVIYDPFQFSYVHDGSRDRGFGEKNQLRRMKRLAYDVLTGLQPDITGGALYYHTTEVKPRWAAHMEYAYHVGSHIVYR